MKKDYHPQPHEGTAFLSLVVTQSPEARRLELTPHDQALCAINLFFVQVPANLPEPLAASCALGMFYLTAHPEYINALSCKVRALDGRELAPSGEFDCVDVAESYPWLLLRHED